VNKDKEENLMFITFMKIKNCFLFFSFTVVIMMFLVSCRGSDSGSPAKKESLLVEGEVVRDFYSSFMSTGSDVEYRVEFRLKNIGDKPLVCDEIEAAFFSFQGTALRMPTYRYDEGKEAEQEAYQTGKRLTFELLPGQTEKFEKSTDGYTTDLLTRAQGEPLKFSVALKLNDVLVAGPFVATLPEIQSLPSYVDKWSGKTEGYRLKFFKPKR